MGIRAKPGFLYVKTMCITSQKEILNLWLCCSKVYLSRFYFYIPCNTQICNDINFTNCDFMAVWTDINNPNTSAANPYQNDSNCKKKKSVCCFGSIKVHLSSRLNSFESNRSKWSLTENVIKTTQRFCW